MRASKLGRLIGQNLSRNRGPIALAGAGIVLAIATLVFFLGLAGGISRVLLGEVFPVERLEVVPAKTGIVSGLGDLTQGLVGGSAGLDDALVAKLRERPEVAGVFPKMTLTVPGKAWGGQQLFGQNRYAELIADGVDPALVDDLGDAFAKDIRDVPGGPAPGKPPYCENDEGCVRYPGTYCAWDVHECQNPVPVAISPMLLELYNGHIAQAHGYPKVTRSLVGVFKNFVFYVELGASFMGMRTAKVTRQRRLMLAGVSDRAMRVGLTLPLGVVREWNTLMGGEQKGKNYSTLLVKAKSKSQVTQLAAYIKSLGLDIADNGAEQAGLFVTLLTLLFALISLVVVGIAALNIAHTFITLVGERRREIGVLRAVGATRVDVRLLILGEATVVGLAFGALGTALGIGCARLVDTLSARVVPDFPFKPTSYFAFSPWLCVGAVAFAVICSVLGAWVPASRAARLEPALALAAR